MPTVIETTVYQFDELSEAAKERARNWFRECTSGDADMLEHVLDDAIECGAVLGIEISGQKSFAYDVGGYRGGDFAAFSGSYEYRRGAAKAIRAYAPLDKDLHKIADALQAIQRRHFYRLSATTRTTHRDDMSVSLYDEGRHDATQEADDAISEALSGFAHWICCQLTKELEYRMSDECVDEDIRANGYTFDEDGRRFG